MSALSKRTTVYFDPEIHQALKMKAEFSKLSVSEIIDEAVRLLIIEDHQDLQVISERKQESEMSYAALIKHLKSNGKI
jgi:hypothetical protein